MKRWVYVICLTLLFFFITVACNTANKSDKPVAATTDAVSGSAQLSSNITNINVDRTEKLDEDLFRKVDIASSTADKLQLLFKALADDSYENHTMYDCDKVLTYTMDLLYSFLDTKKSYDMDSKEFEQLFYGISIIPLEEGRIICFSGKASTFGESSETKYAFYQRSRDGTISAFRLYVHDCKRIESAFIKNIDKGCSLLFTDGYTGMNLGNPKFINAFKIDSNICKNVDALEPYRYKNKEFISPEGLISYEIQIKKFTENEMIFMSGDDENSTLKAYFDSKKLMFSMVLSK